MQITQSNSVHSESGDQIDVDDSTTFFVTYMKNDTLASIEREHPKPRDQIDVDSLTTHLVQSFHLCT